MRKLALGVILAGLANVGMANEYTENDDSDSHPNDPYESFNRAVFSANLTADKYILKPIAKGYKAVTPDIVEKGVTNFFNNIDDVETLANSILQGKFHNSVVTLNRIIYNTIFGLGGLIDVATSFGLENTEEDFGQTLAVWGYEDSDFLMLPLLGPSTFRDFGGLVVDTVAIDPVEWVYEDIEDSEKLALQGINVVSKRASFLAAENLLVGDQYAFIRNAYFQNREYLIYDGDVEDSFADEEFSEDDLEGF